LNPTSLLSSSAAVPSNGPDGEPRPRDSAEAAHQFESLLVAQMLRTARESSDNGMDD
jgi:Rod binding domain-containing protein